MQGIFITGTDTGVGKTLVAGALAAAARKNGARVGVFKPCESGCSRKDGSLHPNDAVFLRNMSGSTDPLDKICPYRLQEALAPAVAAERENINISTHHILKTFHELAAKNDVMIVEGAGGLLVPIAEDVLTLDLIRQLGLPVAVVARLSLGTINHCLLTVRQIQAAGLPLKGIIFNRTLAQETAAEQTNPTVLQRYTDVPVLGCLPFLGPDQQHDPDIIAGIAQNSLQAKRILPETFNSVANTQLL